MTDNTVNKRILVTGGNGQVGHELSKIDWPSTSSALITTRVDLDITDQDSVDRVIGDFMPDVIVNTAAYTAVDRAETEIDQARLVNETAVGYLASAADKCGAGLIHLSTDYVFDGLGTNEWYVESDKPNPVSVYGETKLAGEKAALTAKKAVVLRTSGVYSSHGSNFVKTMLRIAKEGSSLRVIDDQYLCPTAALDLAHVICSIIEQDLAHTGLFHAASVEGASWWEVAAESIKYAGYEQEIEKITTEEYPLPAKRPPDSRLSSTELTIAYGVICPPWRESLSKVVNELIEKVPLN